MENTTPKILIAVPTMGHIHTTLTARLLHYQARMKDQVSFYFSDNVAPVDRARNQIIEKFLHIPGTTFTHLFFIDSDTIPPPDALERLLAHDKDIVSGLTPIAKYDDDSKTYFTIDNCFLEAPRDEFGKATETLVPERNTGLHQIVRCGGSCVLIKRKVFERLEPPYYDFDYNAKRTEHTRSEDIRFCDNAIAAGFEIYADSDVVCGHHKAVMM
jgi:GT2 family glycosyltransferase